MNIVPNAGAPLPDLLARLKAVKKSGHGYTAKCPAHEDGRASLSVTEGRDGRVLVHCFAGCEVAAIVAAVGLSAGDLFSAPAPRSQAKQILDTYDYCDAAGQVRYQVVRFFPKDFRQRRWMAGAWMWGLAGVTPVLYRWPELIEARAARRTIFIVEGEKDANALVALGLVATTNSGGAKKWREEFAEEFRGARVVVLPDNDDVGRAHAGAIAAQLVGLAASLRVVELPGLAPKMDVSDWIDAGGTKASLNQLVMATPEWVAMPPAPRDGDAPPVPGALPAPPLTDIGNAERLLRAHGEDLRWVPRWSKFLVWQGTHWALDESLETDRRCKATVRALYVEAEHVPTTAERKKLLDHAGKSESNRNVVAALARFRAEPGVAITTDALNTDHWALPCANGTVDLRTGALRPAQRGDLATKTTGLRFDPDATAPRWRAFLDEAMGGDVELVAFMQRAVGYALTGNVSEQCLFFLHGSGANGKSTFLEVLRALLGEFATQADFSTFLERRIDQGPRPEVARLYGARIVTSSEVGEGKRLNESLIKQLTGSDVVTARALYAESFEFAPAFKLWFAANHRPIIKGTDDAVWRRLRLVPFAVQIPVENRDSGLLDTLRAELPGILAWAVNGTQLWLEQGLRPPAAVLAATSKYRSDSDVLGSWIEELCGVSDRHAKQKTSELYASYRTWCEAGGEHAVSARAFAIALEERGFRDVRGTAGAHFRVGLSLISAAAPQGPARSNPDRPL